MPCQLRRSYQGVTPKCYQYIKSIKQVTICTTSDQKSQRKTDEQTDIWRDDDNDNDKPDPTERKTDKQTDIWRDDDNDNIKPDPTERKTDEQTDIWRDDDNDNDKPDPNREKDRQTNRHMER